MMLLLDFAEVTKTRERREKKPQKTKQNTATGSVTILPRVPSRSIIIVQSEEKSLHNRSVNKCRKKNFWIVRLCEP